jgi:hypothetical protein
VNRLDTLASRVVIGITLVLTLGIVWQFALEPYPSRAALTSTVVALSGERIEQSSAAVADFDGDGDKEIVIGGRDGMLYVLAYNGSSWSVVWSRQTAQDLNGAGAPSDSPCVTSQGDVRSSPAIADLDDDGRLEIVVTTGGDPANHRNGGVLVYQYTSPWSFSLVPGWPQPKLDIVGEGAGASFPDGCWDGIWSSPAVGDLDGDGDLEVVVEGFDRRLHVWHHNGVYASGWPIAPPDVHRGGWASPAIADIDGDSLPEVIFATDDYGSTAPPYLLYVFNGDGSPVPGFPVEASQNMQSSPAIGDINDDGWLEIVVGTGTYETTGGNKVYAWDHTGNLLSGWPQTTGGNMPAPPALGDLDNDGDLEVVIGCGAEGDPYPAPCTSLYAWHGDGSVVAGFPQIPPANNPWAGGDTPNGLPYTPVLADYDGDGSVEILVLNRWAWGVSAVENNGQIIQNPPFVTQNALSSSPLVDDVDDDGDLEVVIAGATSEASGSKGAVYIWDVNGGVDDALPWPMFHRDVARTGLYPLPPKMVFPSEIRLFHQYGSGDTEMRDVQVQNTGGGEFDWSITHSIARLRTIPPVGMVIDSTPVQFVVTTTNLVTDTLVLPVWHELGTVTITGTVNGRAVDGSPIHSKVYIYVGDVFRAYLPFSLRNY